jgi:hypothetical protein
MVVYELMKLYGRIIITAIYKRTFCFLFGLVDRGWYFVFCWVLVFDGGSYRYYHNNNNKQSRLPEIEKPRYTKKR